jgi:hypothetical protein
MFDSVGDLRLTHHTAAEEDLLSAVAALGVGQSPYVSEYTLFCVFPNGAGVHHHHVGTLGFLDDFIAALGQKAPDPLRIRLILLATVGFHIGAGDGVLFPPVGGDVITILKLLPQLFFRNNGGFAGHV